MSQRREVAAPDPLAATGELARLRAVVQAIPFGIALEDATGGRVLTNDAATRLAGSANRVVETTRQALDLAGDRYVLTTSQDVTEQRLTMEQLFDRAYIDELTGLPNRGLFDRSMQDLLATIEPGQRFALAFLDLDNFKHINDFYSHAVGDALLVKIAQRVSSLLRPTDILARIGGDEFVLLLTPLDGGPFLQQMMERHSARLKDPFFIDGHEIFASASIGVSVYPEHGTNADALRRNADCAMYRAKAGAKGHVVIFDDLMSHAVSDRMKLEQRFRQAVRDRRFTCAFQPKVDIRSQSVEGVEVLLRWRDEQGVIQPPGDFVNLAIELGLINDITFLLLSEIVDTLPEIDDIFGERASISVNIAAKQAVDLPFMTAFCDALERTGVPGRFMVEITEEAFLKKDHFRRDILPKLRAVGVKVSIDDFGVGYSSLAALADITADEVKIDRSFITDIHKRPRSQSVLKAIESLAQALGMSIVAEGIETYEELVWLQACTGIKAGQGYYFAKPAVLGTGGGGALRRTPRNLPALGRLPTALRFAAGTSR